MNEPQSSRQIRFWLVQAKLSNRLWKNNGGTRELRVSTCAAFGHSQAGTWGTTGEHSRRIAARDWLDGRDGLIWFICVCLVYLVSLMQPNKPDRPNKQVKPAG